MGEKRHREGPELSVVIPLLDEAGGIDLLVCRLLGVLRSLGTSFEVLLVDDGSHDATWERIQAAHRRDPRVKGIRLWRNFGHQAALLAGLRHASGEAVVTMDGDLQHPPELVPRLLEAWRRGARVVNTRRLDSPDTGLLKRLTSRWFYRVFGWLSGVPLGPGSSELRLVDRRVRDVLLEMGHQDLFLRGAVSWVGGEAATVEYRARPRVAGKSKFGLGRMLRLSAAALVSYSTLPLRLGIWLGLMTGALAGLEILYILVQYFRGQTVPGWASLLTVVSFMFGVLFVLLGILGSYVASIHQALMRRPAFVLAEAVGVERPEQGEPPLELAG